MAKVFKLFKMDKNIYRYIVLFACVQPCTTRPSPHSQLDVIILLKTELEQGIIMYDAVTKKEVFVQCPILCIVCDNPRTSEVAHHMGSSANHFCRACDIGFLHLTINSQLIMHIPFINTPFGR